MPAAGVLVLGQEVLERQPVMMDVSAMTWLHAHTGAGLQIFGQVMNIVGGPWVTTPLFVLLPLLLWILNRRYLAVFAVVGLGLAEATQWLLKVAYGRPRPDLWPSDVYVSGLSFPSGHATAAAALAAVLVVLAWRSRWRWLAVGAGVVYAALMGLSRVVLGVHYPTDVLAGALTGLACVMATLAVLPFLRRA
ncbi:phosphatase PAP2 family protein [Deinococcus aquaticus]|uniref:Phosphatase PAP2 family protein n=1 Tax=Deinococcus aquaticus TaxID=328692 RepID=A0ABY7V8G8_9DEIO|nr:phosphatase PAP2 family protein [Deinococcus aquaticus]WDA60532.1 phosphatase PAP2 family protein [Deinococcus aquaticus]